MPHTLLTFPMLSILIARFSFALLVTDKVGITQAESPVDDSVFLLRLVRGVETASPLSASIDPPDVTLILDIWEHVTISLDKQLHSHTDTVSIL